MAARPSPAQTAVDDGREQGGRDGHADERVDAAAGDAEADDEAARLRGMQPDRGVPSRK